MAKGFNCHWDKAKNKITFQTGHQYHSSRLYTNVVDLIKGGKIGKVIAFDSQWNRNRSWRRSVEDPNIERQINWRLYREYSFGLLAELSAHQIDFVNWVLDDNPIKVAGFGGIDFYKDGREVYDNIKVIYEFCGGVKASYTCLSNNSKDGYKISIKGDLGSIDIYQDEAWFYSNINKVQIEEIDGVSGATKSWSGSQGQKLDFKHLSPTKQALTDFRNCIKLTREIFGQDAFKEYAGKEIQPGQNIQSDAALDKFLLENVESAYHPCGTCKMGSIDDPMSVVDPECKVIGVKN